MLVYTCCGYLGQEKKTILFSHHIQYRKGHCKTSLKSYIQACRLTEQPHKQIRHHLTASREDYAWMSGNNGQIFDKRLWVALALAMMLLAVATAKSRSHAVGTPVQQLITEGDALRLVPAAAAGMRRAKPAAGVESTGTTPFFFAPVPLNSADRNLLMTLPGIGPAMADRIISFRRENGPIRDPSDFSRIRGIGPVRLQNLQDLISFE